MIERYLFSILLKYLSIFPVVALVGPRKSGKTTLAKYIARWLGKSTVYMDLEFGSDWQKLDNSEGYLNEHINDCVILDEIHRKQDLFQVIDKITEEHEGPGKFLIITSSGSDQIIESAELLSGKIGYFSLAPLNRLELMTESELDLLWLRGGFPDAFLANDDKESFIWRDNLIQTFCERDLQQMGIGADPYSIRTFLTMLASDQGGIWNASTFARSMGMTSPTMKRYLRFAESAFLVTVLEPYLLDSGKRLIKASKVYMSDSGILHTLLQIESEEELRNHIIMGSSWEGFVIAQIQSITTRKAELYFYQTHQGAKVDLLIVKYGKPLVSLEIQTTDEPKISKGFGIAINDLDTKINYIVTPSSANYEYSHNIEVINLDGLLKELSDKFFGSIK
jgi:predicted AAA+ superfamily ATPase